MTVSLRSMSLLAVLTAALIARAFVATSPSTTIDVSTERRPAAPRATQVTIGQEPLTIPASAPAADARTLLKYRYLLEDINATSAAGNDLLAALQAREEAARVGAGHTTLDAAVQSILNPAQHAMYMALRESDAVQRGLGDFAGGLAHQAPLHDTQRRELLFAKLRHGQQYQHLLEQSGIDRTGLSDEDRSYAHTLLAQALHAYRDAYLQEIRAHLDAEQFRLLSDFERTEFDLELQRLQQSINER